MEAVLNAVDNVDVDKQNSKGGLMVDVNTMRSMLDKNPLTAGKKIACTEWGVNPDPIAGHPELSPVSLAEGLFCLHGAMAMMPQLSAAKQTADYACWHQAYPGQWLKSSPFYCVYGTAMDGNGNWPIKSYVQRPVGLAMQMVANYVRDNIFTIDTGDKDTVAYAFEDSSAQDCTMVVVNRSDEDRVIHIGWTAVAGRPACVSYLQSKLPNPSPVDNNETPGNQLVELTSPTSIGKVSSKGFIDIRIRRYSAAGIKFSD